MSRVKEPHGSFTQAECMRGIPVVNVWSRDPGMHPEEHAHMQVLAAHKDFLQSLLQQHGIARADFTPPLPALTFVPERDAPELQYQLIIREPLSHDVKAAIREQIEEKTGLFGAALLPFTGLEFQQLEKQHNLVRIAGRDIPREPVR